MEHLTPRKITDLLAGRLDRAERMKVVRHLLAGCSSCQQRLAVESQLGTYAPLLTRELRGRDDHQPPNDFISKSPEFSDDFLPTELQSLQGWPLVEALLQTSFEARFRDTRTMLCLALKAVAAAEALGPEEYGPAFIVDMQARAWAELGNAYKVNEDLAKADVSLSRARGMLGRGTGNQFLLARVVELEASLRISQRRLKEACELLDGVALLSRDLGDPHLAGRAYVMKSLSAHYDGHPRTAILLKRKAISLLDPARDPHVLAVVQQGLLDSLVECGEFREAGCLLLKSGLREVFSAEPLGLLQLRWVEGALMAGLCHLPRAESALIEVREKYLDLGLEYQAAIVGLDLASVWLQRRKTRQVRVLAREILDVFWGIGLQREADKALSYLQDT